jgi:predicted GNAT family N-acyltransferase
MTVTITRSTVGDQEWADALVLRRAVLRTPLGLDFSAADLVAESGDTLFAAHDGKALVAVVMLRPDSPDSVKLRQMAVSENMRGQGIGEQLLAAFEAYARELGVRHIGLAARKTAVGFYERQGYIADGDEFIEVTIPHLHMSKTL